MRHGHSIFPLHLHVARLAPLLVGLLLAPGAFAVDSVLPQGMNGFGKSAAGLQRVQEHAQEQAQENAQANAQPEARVPRARLDVDALMSAVVRVKMKAIEGARSSATLGASREGSGVVIDERGHILTIGYIVTEADSIEVVTNGNRTVPAILAAYDHASGFGLLRATSALHVTPMALGNSDALAVREPVMILPAGGQESAMRASVMSRRQFTGSWEYLLETAIFTSPPTMQWAGAALVNREGKLVGIGSLLVRDAVEPGTPQPGNMFVPVDTVKSVLAELIAKGRRDAPAMPWIGLATEESQGRLFVVRVSPEGPADKAGLRPGDIVMGVGADSVGSQAEFYRRLWAQGAAGTEVKLKVLQGPNLRDVGIRSIDRQAYFKDKPSL